MKVEILHKFRDKDHFETVYQAGEIKDFDNDRAADLISRGLVKSLEELEPEHEPNPVEDADANKGEEQKPEEVEKPVKDPKAPKKGGRGGKGGKKKELDVPGTNIPETEVPESAELGDSKEVDVVEVNEDGQPGAVEHPETDE